MSEVETGARRSAPAYSATPQVAAPEMPYQVERATMRASMGEHRFGGTSSGGDTSASSAAASGVLQIHQFAQKPPGQYLQKAMVASDMWQRYRVNKIAKNDQRQDEELGHRSPAPQLEA